MSDTGAEAVTPNPGAEAVTPNALDGQVSAEWNICAIYEWSICPGSMEWRAGENVAPLRRSSAGWMPARIGRLSTGVGRRHPVTIHKSSLMAGSMRWV